MVSLISMNFTFVEASSLDYDHINSLIEQGDYKTALAYLEKLSFDDPNDTGVLFYQGYVLDELGRYEEALNHYDKVLWDKPNDIETLYNKAVTLEKMEDYENAISYYDKVLEVDFGDIDSLLSKGSLLYQHERYEEALVTFQKVLELEPENSDAKLHVNKINQLKSELNPSHDYVVWPYLIGIVGSIGFIVFSRRKRQKIVTKAIDSNQNIKTPNILVKKINWTGLNKDYLALFYNDKLLFARFGKNKMNLDDATVYEILQSDKDNFCIFYHDIDKISILDSAYGKNGERIGELNIDSKYFSGSLDILSEAGLEECRKIIEKINN